MKRLLCVALVLCLALSWGGVFAAGGEGQERVLVEHLLWDIPFGISMEECIALVKERAGVELDYWYSDSLYVLYDDVEEQGATFLGYPVNLFANFNEADDELLFFSMHFDTMGKWQVSFPGDEDEAIIEESFQRYFHALMEVYREIGNLLGTPTGGRLLRVNHGLKDGKGYTYTFSYPMQNGVLDEALAKEFFAEREDGLLHLLVTFYDNVSVQMELYVFRRPEKIRILTVISLDYSSSISMNKEKAYTFEGEDGEYSWRKPKEEDTER